MNWVNDGRRWSLCKHGTIAPYETVMRVYTKTPDCYQVLAPKLYPSHRGWTVMAEMPRLKDAMDFAMVLYKLEN